MILFKWEKRMRVHFIEMWCGATPEKHEYFCALIKGKDIVAGGLGLQRHDALREARLEYGFIKQFS